MKKHNAVATNQVPSSRTKTNQKNKSPLFDDVVKMSTRDAEIARFGNRPLKSLCNTGNERLITKHFLAPLLHQSGNQAAAA